MNIYLHVFLWLLQDVSNILLRALDLSPRNTHYKRNWFNHTIFNISGKPGTDYPILGAVPYTNFYCDEQAYPGFFADMETRCQGIVIKYILTKQDF